jgi:3-oxoacyl-[acyl-carrier protein] reductase
VALTREPGPQIAEAFGLRDKVAIVTGAAGGVGRACAEVFAAAGAAVVCADLLPPDETVAAVKAAAAGGGTVTAAAVDVTSRAAVEELVASTHGAFGRLDVLVNNAGIHLRGSALDTEEAELDRLLATNLKGVIFGCQAAGRVMAAQSSGSIVNIASEVIDRPVANVLAYSASKAGVRQATRTFAVELGRFGVRVNAVAPGWMLTGLTRSAEGIPDDPDSDPAWQERMRARAASYPLGRIGTPADVAYAALYLASPASSFMTGQALRLNGGASMPW